MTLTEEDKDDEYNPDCQKLLLSETIRGKFLYSKIQRFICQKNLIERKSEKKKDLRAKLSLFFNRNG